MYRRVLMEEEVGTIQRQISVDLIGSDLMKTLYTVLTTSVHHDLRSKDVCLEEDTGVLDGTIHMRLRRKIHHDIRMLFFKDQKNFFPVSNIFFVKDKIRILHRVVEGMDVCGVGQGIDADDPPIRSLL